MPRCHYTHTHLYRTKTHSKANSQNIRFKEHVVKAGLALSLSVSLCALPVCEQQCAASAERYYRLKKGGVQPNWLNTYEWILPIWYLVFVFMVIPFIWIGMESERWVWWHTGYTQKKKVSFIVVFRSRTILDTQDVPVHVLEDSKKNREWHASSMLWLFILGDIQLLSLSLHLLAYFLCQYIYMCVFIGNSIRMSCWNWIKFFETHTRYFQLILW